MLRSQCPDTGHCLLVLCGLWRALVGHDVAVPFFCGYGGVLWISSSENTMLAAKLPYLFNILIFIGYFVFYRDGKTWPDQFLWWAWLPYIAHVWFHHFADGLQNTTRNIARIYLIKNHGVDYDRRLVVPIQTALTPDSMLPIVILWVAVHIGSFTTLLFFQGWAIALVAEFVLIIFGGFFPINYQAHLKRVYKYVQKKSLAFQMAGVSTEELTELLGQAISERRNPQLWWGIVLRDATQEIVEGGN